MSASVAELLADLLSPPGDAAKVANPAKSRAGIDPAADNTVCEGLRIPANLPPLPAGAEPDSQAFAGVRKPELPPQSEHSCGSSQDSQVSQGVGDPKGISLAQPEPTNVRGVMTGRASAAGTTRWLGRTSAQPLAANRPYRLSQADADAAHAEPWNDAAIARFVARVGLFLRRGVHATDADDLAERLHLRDLQGDDRRLCVECRHLAGHGTSGWRCGNHVAAGVGRDLPAELATLMQRCACFVEAAK